MTRNCRPGRRPNRAPMFIERLDDRIAPATLSNYLTSEHVDLTIVFAAGSPATWTVRPTDDDNGVAFAADDALLYVGQDAVVARAAGAEFDFVGVAAGANFHRLPQTQNGNLIYAGVSGSGIPATALDRYNPSTESLGRVSGLARWAKMRLEAVKHVTPAGATGNGIFSVWQSGDGTPTVFMSNFNDGVSNPNGAGLDATDGIGPNDALWVTTGGHAHYNFGFSQPGRYEITVRLSGYLDDGNTTSLGTFDESAPVTLYFSVGSVGQFSVDPASVTVNESAGTANVTIVRSGGSDGRVTVNYATANGTAIAGSDYTATSGTITFDDGETQKLVTIPILNDTAEEGDESFALTISQPGPSAIADYVTGIEAKSMLGTAKTATITILANDTPGPNQPPSILPIADQSGTEDAFLSVPFKIGDDQTPANNLVISATSSNTALVANAKIVPGGSGTNRTIAITPNANAFGTTTITVTVTDGGSLQATRSFLLTVTPVADTPSAVAKSTLEDIATTGPTIVINPVDGAEVSHIRIESIVNGGLFKADGTTAVPVGAIVTIAEAASLIFRPAADANDQTTPDFGYTFRAATGATNESVGGAVATASIAVTPVNDRPAGTIAGNVAVPQNAGVVTRPNFVSQFGPGGSFDEAIQTVSFVVNATNPTLFTTQPSIDASGQLTFTVADGQSGISVVSLDIVDNGGTANGGIDTRSFTFEIRVAVNSAPFANDDTIDGTNTEPVTIAVLANDSDLDGQTLSISGFGQPMNGTVTQIGQTLQYVAGAGFTGNDTFTYTATDGTATSNTATVTVNVSQGNRPPVANDDSYLVTAGHELYFNVLANDSDPDGLPFASVQIVSPPAIGALVEAATGGFIYAAPLGFTGSVTLTYRLTDPANANDTATVTIAARAPIEAFANVFSEGDIDLGVGYEDDAFEPHIHDEENEGEFEPGEGVFHLRPAGLLPRPQGPEFAFLGPVQPTIYRFTQSQTGGLLFLGFGAEEVATGTFVNDAIRLRFQSIEGPGRVSIWNNTDQGPEVFVNSSDSIAPADDFIALSAGDHTHYNWAFTAPGLYAVTVTVEGVLAADGTTVVSDPATFFFAVDPVNVAPVLSNPATLGTPYDSGVAVAGVSIADADATGLPYTIEIAATKGTVSFGTTSGVTFLVGDGQTDAAITATGALGDLNAALATLTFVPTAGTIGQATVAIAVTDAGILVGENALADDGLVRIEVAEPIRNRFAVGNGQGPGAWLYNPDFSIAKFHQPFGAAWAGGIRTTAGDVTGDGIDDLVVGTGPGGPTVVVVYDGATHGELVRINPFEDAFTGGVFVSTGDLDGDGKAEFIVSPDEGGGPRVQVYRGGTFVKRADFFGIEDDAFRGGVRTAVGDLNGDGFDDLIVAAGFGGGPRVAAFHGNQLGQIGGPKVFDDFFAFEPALRNGAFVAAGDVNGDGADDIVAGAGPGGGPRVFVLSGQGLSATNATSLISFANFFAGDINDRRGVRVAVADVAGDGRAELIVGSASKTSVFVYAIDAGTESLLQQIDGFGNGLNGVFVG